jgi:hypothetical protein
MKAFHLPAGHPHRLLLLILLGLLASAGGCELEKESLWAPTVGWPVVTGTVIRNESGEIMGIYGDPQNTGLAIYPSPAGGVCTIDFEVPERTRVTVWVSRALGPGVDDPRFDAGLGTTRIPIYPPAEVVNLLDSYLDANRHIINWKGEDEWGVDQPTGWYRIYARIGSEVLFADMWWIKYDDFRFPPGFWDVLNPDW